jgi:signal transduction histidine kinase
MAHILYVEDDDTNARLVSRLLRAHRVEVITSGEEAIDRMEQPPAPDLILLDINLPGLNGFEVMAWLSDREVPVVAHTAGGANNGIPMRDQALTLGCTGFIPKPIPKDFTSRITGYLDGHRDKRPDVETQIAALRAFGRNVTAQLEEEKAELRRLLEERRRFAHAAVHELRTPLAQVAMSAQVIQRGIDMWDDLHAGLKALERRVQDLMTFAGVEHGGLVVTKETVDLAALVEDYAEQHQRLCDACTLEVVAEPVVVEGDEERLRQVMENLVSNAHKYVPQERDPDIEIRVRRENGHALVEVLDNGVGIPAHKRQRIFEPFARLEAADRMAVSGLGLGLSVVYHIVRAHEGIVTCDDAPSGVGSRFVVQLPDGHENTLGEDCQVRGGKLCE